MNLHFFVISEGPTTTEEDTTTTTTTTPVPTTTTNTTSYNNTKKSTIPRTRKYGRRTKKKPRTSIYTISEMQSTHLNDFTVSFDRKYCSF